MWELIQHLIQSILQLVFIKSDFKILKMNVGTPMFYKIEYLKFLSQNPILKQILNTSLIYSSL
ncbi:hypothetical protein B1J94_12705 [Leptospira kirschneri serovar Grippotyphosa]|nr:hypothetical protein B1J94_12705 [Leptospira kirschneri serovar Grippotyphosa]